MSRNPKTVMKETAKLRAENVKLRKRAMDTELSLFRAERERDGWKNVVRQAER